MPICIPLKHLIRVAFAQHHGHISPSSIPLFLQEAIQNMIKKYDKYM